MAEETSIPVDVFNPGQVFACLGFLEASDVLCHGDAEGRFDWSDESDARFFLRVSGEEKPFSIVLDFLAGAEVKAIAPPDWRPKKEPKNKREEEKLKDELRKQVKSMGFPAEFPDTSSAMPVQIKGRNNQQIVRLGHWADGSSRDKFKLYSGYRSARDIVVGMLSGTRAKPRKGQENGDLKTKGIDQLWEEERHKMIERPFDVTTPLGGSFNFDPRGAWTAIDAGYSPNDQKHQVAASPVVEILSAWGLENARPDESRPDKSDTRKVRYAIWDVFLAPMLARVALFGGIPTMPVKRFRFDLDNSGKNKIITYAEQETNDD